jgi:gliding motility-associated-like protein
MLRCLRLQYKHLNLKAGIILFLAFFVYGPVFSQTPVANFSASPLSGCAPFFVQFTDNSTGTVTDYHWELGNGVVSSNKNPSTTYFLPGLYTVKLVVSNASGKDSIVKTNYINILQPPQVSFSTSTSTVGCFPLRVQFLDNSIPNPGGSITAWEWDFGNGTTSTEKNPYYVYKQAGNFNVTLKVTSSNGCSNILTKPSFIRSSQGVKPDFTASNPINCKPPEAITFTNLTTGPGTLTYKWSFGDGGNSTVTNPVHTYTTAGTYSVRLIAESDQGCVDTIVRDNQLNIGNFNSNFTFRNNVCVNDTVGFFNNSQPTASSFTWYFSDGSTSFVKNPIKIFSALGTYTVKLVNNFGSCIDSSIRSINVINNPVPDINADKKISCKTPFTVNFSNTTPGTTQWLWEFGDGSTSTLQNPSHTYSVEGEFTVKLTITLSSGCSGSLTLDKYIIVKKPVAQISGLPGGGCFPYMFTPVATILTADTVLSWLWNFGDGTTSTLKNPSHLYSNQGQYDVSLTITTSSGCTVVFNYPQGIKTGTKPTANFSASPLSSCAGKPIQFTDQSTNGPDSWEWVFGDGKSALTQNPLHAYDTAGTFNVKLIVRKNGCPDSLVKINYVTILPPVSKFGVIYDCNTTTSVTFKDSSFGALTYSWDFGDGTSSTLSNPAHSYAAIGTYKIILTVTNGGCTDTSQKTITLLNLSPVINSDQPSKCKNNTFTFTVSNVNPALISSYLWTFDDGFTSTAASVLHGFSTTGVDNLTLEYTNINGCKKIISHSVNVYGVTASFTLAPALQCANNNVTFTNTSTTDGTNAITSVTWKFGDGKSLASLSNPVNHIYDSAASYLPKIIVKDAFGCADSSFGSTILDIIKPVINFIASDTLSCPGGNIQFFNTSTGSSLSYNWDFGDGNTSTNTNPIHSYSATGVYTVKLIGTEAIGCKDSIIKTNYIFVGSPKADFLLSDTFTICPPIQVQFTNKSTYYQSLFWEFGDGNTSTDTAPKYSYSIPNDYIVTLTATSAGGCIDKKQRLIRVLSSIKGTLTYNPLSGCYPTDIDFKVSSNTNVKFLWDFGDGTTLFTKDSIVKFSYKDPGFYIPKVILQDSLGCLIPITGADTLKIYGSKADFSADKTILCDNGPVQFTDLTSTADIITSIVWNFGDGNSSTLKNPVHNYAAPGSYNVTLTVNTANGCSNSITKTNYIKVSSTPLVIINGNITYCTPALVSLQGSRSNSDTTTMVWEWTIDGKTFTTQNINAYSFPLAGSYPVLLKGTNSFGCSSTNSTTITVNQTPIIKAGNDTTLCLGNSTVLQPSGGSTYAWSPATDLSCTNCNNPVATPTDSRSYFVTGTTAAGCSNKDTIIIRVKKPFTVTAIGGQTVCIGKSVPLSATGAEKYLWSPGASLNDSTSANPVASPQTSTVYTVIGYDSLNCFQSTATVQVNVFPYPIVNAGKDTTIKAGSSVFLQPLLSVDVTSVLWSPSSTLSCSTCISPVATPYNTTSYRIIASNAGNCLAFDDIKITILCDRNNIFIPNAFTPNADNLNDRFFVLGPGLQAIKSLRVYNRWGHLVFERQYFDANNGSLGWDGTFKGQKEPPGIYSYTAEIICGDGGIYSVNGSVTLIR